MTEHLRTETDSDGDAGLPRGGGSMKRYADIKTPEGTRVRFTVPIDRFPFCEIPEGATGTVTMSGAVPGTTLDSAEIALIVTLDERIPDLDEWANEVHFFTYSPEEIGTLEIIQAG